jgi:hypothetical protein
MKSVMKIGFLFVVTVGISSCAGSVKRGVVAMKINETEAHVGIGRGEVNVGDHVELYRNICVGNASLTKGGQEGAGRTCTKQSGGHGEVTEILGNDYAVVKFPPGTEFSEGNTIEKHAH